METELKLPIAAAAAAVASVCYSRLMLGLVACLQASIESRAHGSSADRG
jgi:hypothetical protein